VLRVLAMSVTVVVTTLIGMFVTTEFVLIVMLVSLRAFALMLLAVISACHQHQPKQ
jgi:hypothetical protein